MYQCNKTNEAAVANYCGAMEAGDHLKNGESSKSQIRKEQPTYQHEKLLTELHLEKSITVHDKNSTVHADFEKCTFFVLPLRRK